MFESSLFTLKRSACFSGKLWLACKRKGKTTQVKKKVFWVLFWLLFRTSKLSNLFSPFTFLTVYDYTGSLLLLATKSCKSSVLKIKPLISSLSMWLDTDGELHGNVTSEWPFPSSNIRYCVTRQTWFTDSTAHERTLECYQKNSTQRF